MFCPFINHHVLARRSQVAFLGSSPFTSSLRLILLACLLLIGFWTPRAGAQEWTSTGSMVPQVGSMTGNRDGHTETRLNNGKVLVTSGSSNGSGNLNTCEIFDPAGGGGVGTWTNTSNMTFTRTYHTATLLNNGKVLVAGGVSNGAMNSCEIFDPSGNGGAGSWTTTASMAATRYLHTATLLNNGKVLVAGGYSYSSRGITTTTTCEIFDPSGNGGAGSWTTTASMVQSRRSHTATLLTNGQVLVTGGQDLTTGNDCSNTCEIFDPSGNGGAGAWNSTANMTVMRINHTATLLGNGKVLVTGGYSPDGPAKVCEIFDPAGNGGVGAWNSTASLKGGRASHTATLLSSGKVLVTGGNDNGYPGVVSTCEIFDPSGNDGVGTWTTTASMAATRYLHTATLLNNGKVLVAGGYSTGSNGSSSILNMCELFDPAGNGGVGTWVSSTVTGARSGHTATRLGDGKVLVVGGTGNNGLLSTCQIFDPTGNGGAGSWSITASLAAVRRYHTATLLNNGKVLVTGGTASSVIGIRTCEIFDPAGNGGAGSWSTAANMIGARQYHTATLLNNGKVLVVGGTSSSSGAVRTCEIFDPAGNGGAGSWSTTASLTVGRSNHTATLLSNGQVLVAGGSGGSGAVNTCEIFDPAGNSGVGTWSTTASLTGARYYHTATLLNNGQVLITGGTTSSSIGDSALNTCEIFDPAGNGGAGTWSSTANIAAARRSHTATLLNNGKVLVVGGSSSFFPAYQCEIFDPAGNGGLGTWSLTLSSTWSRVYHTATLLNNGKVLVAGGSTSSSGGGALDRCELYRARTAPTLLSFTPTSGPVGTKVTLTGTDLRDSATAVKFNGTSATYTGTGQSQLVATVPVGATTGPISVTTLEGTVTTVDSFTVLNSAPVVKDVELPTRLGSQLLGRLEASDADGEPLTFTAQGGRGFVSFDSRGFFLYTPNIPDTNAGDAFDDTFTVAVSDGIDTTTANLTIHVASYGADTPFYSAVGASDVQGYGASDYGATFSGTTYDKISYSPALAYAPQVASSSQLGETLPGVQLSRRAINGLTLSDAFKTVGGTNTIALAASDNAKAYSIAFGPNDVLYELLPLMLANPANTNNQAVLDGIATTYLDTWKTAYTNIRTTIAGANPDAKFAAITVPDLGPGLTARFGAALNSTQKANLSAALTLVCAQMSDHIKATFPAAVDIQGNSDLSVPTGADAVLVFNPTTDLFVDGFHPNDSGYNKLATRLFRLLDKQLNHASSAIGLSNASVVENAAVETGVGTLSSSDQDAGDSFTYSLVMGAGDSDNAAFTIDGNTLKTANVFDYETKSSYRIRIRSTDAGGRFFEKSFTITVTDANDAPVAVNNGLTLNERTSVTIKAANLGATDVDAAVDTLTFSLTVAPTQGTLLLNSVALKSGDSFTSADIAAGQLSYSHTGVGSDSFGFSLSDGTATVPGSFAITVTPVPPTVTSVTRAAGATNPTNASSLAFTVTFSEGVTGVDTGDFSLTTAGLSGVSISGLSGSGSTYTVTVSGAKGSGTLRLNVLDDDSIIDNTNNTLNGGFSSGESYSVDTVEPTVTINQGGAQADPAVTPGAPIVFDVVFSEPVTGFNNLDVQLSGTAGATSAVVSGSGAAYTLTVSGMTQAGTVIASVGAGVASDVAGNLNMASTSTDNTVTYSPQYAPSAIALSKTSVSEKLPVDTSVGTLSSTDANAGETFTYSLVGGDTSAFSLSGTSLRTAQSFDVAAKNSYVITVRSTDAAGLFFEQSFTITVLDATKPVVTISAPTENQKMLIASFVPGSINGGASDNVGVASVRVRLARKRNNINEYWNGTEFGTVQNTVLAALYPMGWTLTNNVPAVSQLDEGLYSLQVSAYDAAGNKSAYAERSFTLLQPDLVAPTITLTAPIANQKVLVSDFLTGYARGSAADARGVTAVKVRLSRKVGTVTYYWNGTDFVTTNSMVDADVTGTTNAAWKLLTKVPSAGQLTAGTYSIAAYALDAAGNKSATVTMAFSLSTDFLAPNVSIRTPTQNQAVNIDALVAGSISGTADDNIGVTSVKLKLQRTRNAVTTYWNGTDFTTTVALVDATITGGTWSYDSPIAATKLDKGAYTVYATAYDAVGNLKTSSSRIFSVVGTPSAPAAVSVDAKSAGSS